MGSPENRCEFVLTPAEKYRQQEAVEDVQVEQTDDGWKLEVLRDGEWGTESVDEQYWNLKHNPFSCCREAWQDGRCVWHAEVEDKPAADLEAERTDYPERLDCAVLSGTEIRDTIFFRDCSLAFSDCAEADFRESNFSDASLEEANLNNADLRDTDLSHANLWRADLTHANLRNANLAGAELNTAILTNAFFLDANLKNTTLKETNLRDAFLENANLENADLREADLNKANLSFANLARTNLQDADFTNATTNRADLTNAELQRTNLTDASLNRTDLTGANLRKTDLTDASLEAADLSNASFQMANLTDSTLAHSEANRVGFERAVLTQADLFDANLIGARFYATTFDGTKINRGTKFGDASDDGLDEAESVDTEDGDTTLWDKTAWKYRQLHELALDNALPEKAREYHITRKNVRRREYRARGGFADWWRWLKASASLAVWEYGENPRRVIGFSLLTILAFGLLFPFFGGMQAESSPDTQAFAFDPITTGALDLPNWVTVVLANLYFSGVTFTTLGYGDIQPATPAVETLATIESFLGALLMALLVFVLGRRSTW